MSLLFLSEKERTSECPQRHISVMLSSPSAYWLLAPGDKGFLSAFSGLSRKREARAQTLVLVLTVTLALWASASVSRMQASRSLPDHKLGSVCRRSGCPMTDTPSPSVSRTSERRVRGGGRGHRPHQQSDVLPGPAARPLAPACAVPRTRLRCSLRHSPGTGESHGDSRWYRGAVRTTHCSNSDMKGFAAPARSGGGDVHTSRAILRPPPPITDACWVTGPCALWGHWAKGPATSAREGAGSHPTIEFTT